LTGEDQAVWESPVLQGALKIFRRANALLTTSTIKNEHDENTYGEISTGLVRVLPNSENPPFKSDMVLQIVVTVLLKLKNQYSQIRDTRNGQETGQKLSSNRIWLLFFLLERF